MEALEIKYSNFKNCYTSLGNVIALQKDLYELAADNPIADNLFTAGVIKHFELTYETCWKFLKLYLTEKYGADIASTKQIFRACETYKLFPTHITNALITLADARNATTHIYNQILAQEICREIIKYHQIFGYIIETLQN
jgi:nucleotidyltransferase substrate binding protein (TIGR01987 family)